MESRALIRITTFAAALLLTNYASAATQNEYSCSCSDDKTDVSLDGRCTLTETTLHGNVAYIMKIKNKTVSVEYVKSSGADHQWLINGNAGYGFEINREHLHGATYDLNEVIEWQDRP
jgi:hypothetical protein